MEIVHHPLCNAVIAPPADMPEPTTCLPLPIHQHKDGHGVWSVSFWKPSDEEIAQIVAGATIALHVRAAGRQHPVVGLAVQPD